MRFREHLVGHLEFVHEEGANRDFVRRGFVGMPLSLPIVNSPPGRETISMPDGVTTSAGAMITCCRSPPGGAWFVRFCLASRKFRAGSSTNRRKKRGGNRESPANWVVRVISILRQSDLLRLRPIPLPMGLTVGARHSRARRSSNRQTARRGLTRPYQVHTAPNTSHSRR